MSKEIRTDFACPPDRERMVASLFLGDEQWAELNQETDRLILEIYPKRQGKIWQLDFEEALRALSQARDRLVGGSTPR